MYTEIWWGNLKGRDQLEDLSEDVTVDLKEKGWCGVDCFNLAQDNDTRVSCEHGDETSGLIKCGKFD